jgi:hypothetical protein
MEIRKQKMEKGEEKNAMRKFGAWRTRLQA